MTHPMWTKLTRVLELERRQGFQNRAVIGGLEGFVAHWVREAQPQLPANLVASVGASLNQYKSRDLRDRRRGLDEALHIANAQSAADPVRVSVGRGDAPPAPPAPPARARPEAPPTTHSVAQPGTAASPKTRTNPTRTETRRKPAAPRLAPLLADDPGLGASVTAVRGVGEKAAARLARLGLHTVDDLLNHVPHRYRDYSETVAIADIETGRDLTVTGRVVDVRSARGKAGKQVVWVLLEDATGRLRLSFFNQPYLAKSFRPGSRIAASGKVEQWGGRAVMNGPEWEKLNADGSTSGRIVPIYPLTEGVTQRFVLRHVQSAVSQFADLLGDPLPVWLREEESLCTRPDAYRAIHTPQDAAERDRGFRRLAFEELLGLQLWFRQKRRARRERRTQALDAGRGAMDLFLHSLPWPLTEDQRAAIEEIAADLSVATPMSRLLQGDVGCGKTVVAAAALVQCAAAGAQAALMAPTEILARQHVQSLGALLEPAGWRTVRSAEELALAAGHERVMGLLVGGMRDADKIAMREAAAAGGVRVLVGTQAVIQETVALPEQALSIVDEQHRFGVMQRATLDGAADGSPVQQGEGPAVHSLVMTATPIPRTLAHVFNADLDHTVIEQMPRGRRPIETEWLAPDQRERAYAYIRKRVDEEGDQAYIIYPLVETSEHVEARAAVEEYERLRSDTFADLRLALVHGRMPPAEKEAAMAAFHAGDAQVLVSTTVVEVGVDVPNATVMLIDGAERFGLAQLHQLRGRVGRGSKASMCLLVTSGGGKVAHARIRALTERIPDATVEGGTRLRNGLELAERDLELRGPGEYFGTRQSGVLDPFRFARLSDTKTLAAAVRVAERVLDEDPQLKDSRHGGLARLTRPYHEGAARK